MLTFSKPPSSKERNFSQLNSHIQCKLHVGQPNDIYEQEADRVANQVMQMPQPSPPVQRKCEDCEEETLQMKPLASTVTPIAKVEPFEEEKKMVLAKPVCGGLNASTLLSSQLNQSKCRGESLPASTNQQMSTAFGTDFSSVRVHTDSNAIQMNRSIGARAFAYGSDLYFNSGQFDPGSERGKHLLAHELTHVVQQDGQNNRIQRDLATPLPEQPAPEQPDLTEAQIREAIRFNRTRYDEENTRLIQDIMGGPVTGEWTEDNILAIAEIQEMYNLQSDGRVGPDTFRFIAEEQRLEGTYSENEDCLTMFRVLRHPTRVVSTPGPGGATRIIGHHIVEAQFSDRCDCSEFEYRQFIAGVAIGSRGGVSQDFRNQFPMPGGLPIRMAEDENTLCPAAHYGHRSGPAQNTTNSNCGENRYFNEDGTTDQANGCSYRGEDFPQLGVTGLNTGDDVDLFIEFQGVIERNRTPVQTKTWTGVDETVRTR